MKNQYFSGFSGLSRQPDIQRNRNIKNDHGIFQTISSIVFVNSFYKFHLLVESIPNGDIHRDYSSPEKALLQLPVSGAFVPSPLYSSPNQMSNSSGEFFCDICYLPFTSASLFYQHNITVHNFYKEVNLKYLELFTSSVYCSLCLQHFNSATSYTEHFFSCHNGFPPNQWLHSSPPEQVKPTDLTTNRKQSIPKRSSDDEQVPTPKKKTKVRESLTNAPPNTNNVSKMSLKLWVVLK